MFAGMTTKIRMGEQCFRARWINSAHAYNNRVRSSSAIAEGPRDVLGQLKSCQLLHNCTKNQIWLEGLPFHVV